MSPPPVTAASATLRHADDAAATFFAPVDAISAHNMPALLALDYFDAILRCRAYLPRR